MSISKDVIKQCLISKQREVDVAVIVNRPTDFEKNGNYVIVGVRHAGKSYLLYQRVHQLQAAGKGWDEKIAQNRIFLLSVIKQYNLSITLLKLFKIV